jgi:hypothetical protein
LLVGKPFPHRCRRLAAPVTLMGWPGKGGTAGKGSGWPASVYCCRIRV